MGRMKSIKSAYLYVWFIVVVALLTMCLMWTVYLIPIDKIRENARPSAEILTLTPRFLWYKTKIPSGTIDKITDARMLNMASFLGRGDSFRDSLLNPETYYVWWAPTSLTQSLAKDILDEGTVFDYPRFWHGYLLLLKPLLVFFDLGEIRIINLIFQAGLLLAILYLMYKRLGFKHCAAFMTAVSFLNPVTSWMCLEYANVINVMLLTMLWVLINKNPDDKYIFFVIGVVTILFDFITFPLVTLGIPLIAYILLYKRGFKDDIKCVFRNSLLWLFGYAGTWLMKWGLATMLTDQNVIKNGWDNVIHRMYGFEIGDSVNANDINILKSIQLNLQEFYSIVSLYYFCIFLVIIIGSCLFYRYKIKVTYEVLVLLGIGLMPFVWYSVLVNHSVIHAYLFAHKILVVSVYAVLSAIVCCFEAKKRENRWVTYFTK